MKFCKYFISILAATWVGQVTGGVIVADVAQLPKSKKLKLSRALDDTSGGNCVSEVVVMKGSKVFDSFKYKCADKKSADLNEPREYAIVDKVVYTSDPDRVWWIQDENKCERHDYKGNFKITYVYNGKPCDKIAFAVKSIGSLKQLKLDISKELDGYESKKSIRVFQEGFFSRLWILIKSIVTLDFW